MAKLSLFERRRRRVRTALKSRAGGKPRLSVHRTGRHIYAQIIDDANGTTVAAASTLDKELKGKLKTGANLDAAKEVGKLIECVVTDVAFPLQHFEHVRTQLRSRRLATGHARLLGIPDAGQHISQGIAQRHLSDPPYQLALTMPGIWPVDASSRSAMRDSLNLR